MKLKKSLLSFGVIGFFAAAAFAQSPEQIKKITRNYDVQKLEEISQQLEADFERRQAMAFDYARAHNLPFVVDNMQGGKSYLHSMDDKGNLIYVKNNDVSGATTIGANQLYLGGSVGVNLTGSGMKLGVWDGGKIRGTHELLSGKVTYKDNAPSLENHATHVAGIAAGKKLMSGPGQTARGIAYEANVDGYDWNNDASEMNTAAIGGLLVSNHSYGADLSQVPNPSAYLGTYDMVSRQVDNIAFNHPYYTLVSAAGNDRDIYQIINPTEGGYNLLAGWMATSKNTIVVAAVNQVNNYTGPSSVVMSNFSSWGPTADNRVKPDISAKGVSVYSSIASTDQAYDYYPGTSMAAPAVAGAVLLMQELSSNLNDGDFLWSSTIRALIIQTARQADNTPGPNPRFGWGLMAVDKAAQLMIDSHNGTGPFYDELQLNASNTSYTKSVIANEDGEIKVTIAWTDKGVNPPSNKATPVLENDLDLRITDSQGTTYYPWSLSPVMYSAAPTNNGDNNVDNVEQVYIPNAVPGESYLIKVTSKTVFTGNRKQDFSIAGTGMQTLSVDNQKLTGFSVYPNPASDIVNIKPGDYDSDMQVEIFDMNGRKVAGKDFKDTSAAAFSVDVSNLNKGVYFMKISAGGKTATEKLIVK